MLEDGVDIDTMNEVGLFSDTTSSQMHVHVLHAVHGHCVLVHVHVSGEVAVPVIIVIRYMLILFKFRPVSNTIVLNRALSTDDVLRRYNIPKPNNLSTLHATN